MSRYFWPILTPLLQSHFITHLGSPQSTSHISDPTPIFSRPSKKYRDKSPLYNFSLICSQGILSGVLSRGLLFGRFCLGWYLSVPRSVTIHLLQQKVTHHFKFHVSCV